MSGFLEDEEFEEELDEETASEKRTYTLKEIEEMNKKDRIMRIITSSVHLVLIVGAFIGCWIWTKDIILAVGAYLLGFLAIKLLLSFIPDMGTYVGGGYVDVYIGNGEYVKQWDDKAVTKYGFFNVLGDVIMHLIGFVLLVVFAYYLLPYFMFVFLFVGGVGLAVIKYLALPVIRDVCNIIAKKAKNRLFNTIDIIAEWVCVVLIVVSIVGAYFVLPNVLPQKLDVIEALDVYCEEEKTTNNLKGVDPNKYEIKYKHASTVAEFDYEGDLDCGNGIIKNGRAQILYRYNFEEWQAERASYEFNGELKIVSPVTYSCDDEIFSMANYESPSIVKIRIDYFDGTTGKGNYEVIEKSTGNVVFTTPLTIGMPVYGKFGYTFEFFLETPINVGYFGYGKFLCDYDMGSDTFEIKEFGEKFSLEK